MTNHVTQGLQSKAKLILPRCESEIIFIMMSILCITLKLSSFTLGICFVKLFKRQTVSNRIRFRLVGNIIDVLRYHGHVLVWPDVCLNGYRSSSSTSLKPRPCSLSITCSPSSFTSSYIKLNAWLINVMVCALIMVNYYLHPLHTVHLR